MEWTRSLWEDYPYPAVQRERARREDLKADPAKRRVLLGGAFYHFRRLVRCAYRCWFDPYLSYGDIGFRVVVLPAF